LFIIAVIAVLYIYYKKRKQPQTDKTGREQGFPASTSVTSQRAKPVQIYVPEERVRKVYFDFEKWLAAKDMGRYQNETIPEWADRLELTDIIDKQRLTTYIETRYSDMKADDRDFRIYKENIRMMKKEIDEYIKKNKKTCGND